MSFRLAFKTSFGHLQDVLAGCLACLEKASCRCLFADWGLNVVKKIWKSNKHLLYSKLVKKIGKIRNNLTLLFRKIVSMDSPFMLKNILPRRQLHIQS